VPRTRDLGFGYKIAIKPVSPAMMKAMGCDGWAGAWVADEMTIYLDKSMSLIRKAEAYFHELGHAVSDMQIKVRGGI
jgi:hypothetical protein